MAGQVICLDTNYLILGLVAGSREGRELSEWIASGERLVTPTLAWCEFLCGPVTAAQIVTNNKDDFKAFRSDGLRLM